VLKTLNFILIIELILSLYLISCESERDTNLSDPEFILEFSDSTSITENDLLFYDSSTYLLFLKRDFNFNLSISGFKVLVDNDTIYQGIIYPCKLSTPPSSQFFISDCFLYGYDIIEIGCYGESNDLRNDLRIISALKNSNLLLNGITCHIDSIKVNSFEDYSEVICVITIKNNDNINYYILDPEKMGELDFNYFTGGLSFKNIETGVKSFLRWSIPNPDWDNITINDFSIITGDSEITYTFKSSDYHKMDEGIYIARFRFCGTKHKISEFELNQKNGRIWVGDSESSMDSILVE
jgi:hypothetical protein